MYDQREKRQKQINRHQCWGCCFIVSAVILVTIACFTPKLMDSVITSQAQKSAQLTEANEKMWAGIPGEYDLELDWIHYFYNCTNYEDVSQRTQSKLLSMHRFCSKMLLLSLRSLAHILIESMTHSITWNGATIPTIKMEKKRLL